MSWVRQVWAGVAVAAVVAAGCRTPPPSPVAVPPPPPPLAPPDLPAVAADSLEPDPRSLPTLDPSSATIDDVAAPPAAYRGLTEDVCRREAAARATLAGVLAEENHLPSRGPEVVCGGPAAEALVREVRDQVAAEARNRAAALALEQFFQLADAEGRIDLLRGSLPVLDDLRATVKMARAEGLRAPFELDELDRQRGTLLGLAGQADLAARLLDIDLRRRLGLPGKGTERLRPVGPFPVSADPVDVGAAVQVALERRADLRALRAVYLGLTPETLPTVREVIRRATETGGLMGRDVSPGPVRRAMLTALLTRNRPDCPDPALLAEVAVRRRQLSELIAERERQAADQVRAAAATLDAQGKQVGLARWRADRLTARAEDVKKQGPLAELPARLEAYRARADVVAAVMTWHQARVKLLAAQGRLAGE